MVNSIDFHCHLLPGIDDGAVDTGQSLLMAQMLAEEGFSEVCCTPHYIKGIWNTKASEVRDATSRLQEELERMGIPLRLHPGMEYYLDEYLLDALEDPLLLPGNLLLVEFPTHGNQYIIERIISRVMQFGLTPLIAHPERCPLIEPLPQKSVITGFWKSVIGHSDDNMKEGFIYHLLESGCKFQGNIGSFSGYYGESVRKKAFKLQEQGIYECLGSDAHTSVQLHEILKRGIERVNSIKGKRPDSLING